MDNMENPFAATPKAQAIDTFLTSLTGRDRKECVDTLTCATCGGDCLKHAFRDPLSWKEFQISGMCQKCQDSVFGVEEE